MCFLAQLGVSVRTVERGATRADIKQAVQDVQAKAIEGASITIMLVDSTNIVNINLLYLRMCCYSCP